MALLDTLRARRAAVNQTVSVDCGALGAISARALTARECVGGDRGVLYAASPELQAAGERLRAEGLLFQPDEIMQFVSDSEAKAGADAVRKLSGLGESPAGAKDGSEVRPDSVQTFVKQNRKIRHNFVQGSAGQLDANIRPETVQPFAETFPEIRLETVQENNGAIHPADGQVSREFFRQVSPKADSSPKPGDLDKKAQTVVVSDRNPTQNVDDQNPSGGTDFFPGSKTASGGGSRSVHEIRSEIGGTGPGNLHETESDLRAFRQNTLHEMKSDFPKTVHEITSESGPFDAWDLHEITSESAEKLARLLLLGLKSAAGAC